MYLLYYLSSINMIPYELLPHEYSYALYLSYGFDLCLYDPMILNMVSERYPRDEDYASDSDSVSDSNSDSDSETDADFSDTEDDAMALPQWLFLEPQEEDALLLQQESSQNKHGEIIFGSFRRDSNLVVVPVTPLISIKPEFNDFTIKIGDIECSFVTANRSGNLISRTFKQSNNGGSSISEQQLFPEVEDEEGTIDLQFNAADLPVSIINKEPIVTKQDQTEHHQDPPLQVISHFAIPSFDPVFNSPFSINFFCKSGSEISCVALSMHRMTLDLENHHLPAPPWFSTGKTVVHRKPSATSASDSYDSKDAMLSFLKTSFKSATRFLHSVSSIFFGDCFFSATAPSTNHCVSFAPLLLSSVATPWISPPASVFEMTTVFVIESGVWISDLTNDVFITTFDPGGTLTEIYYTVVVLMLLSRFVQVANPSRAGVFVFDPGGSHHQPPWISLRTSTFPPAVVLSRKFQKLPCFLSRLNISLHYNLALFCYCASLKEMAHSMVLWLHFRGILGWY